MFAARPATAARPTAARPADPAAHPGPSGARPAPQPAVLWTDAGGLPLRLVVGGERWRVSDRPTVITEPVSWWSRLDPDATAIGSAPRTACGWRFQATTEDGRSCVFDVRDGGDSARWLVVKVYE
ncbi:hypothetical protein OVN18_07765 [Microcella daejeonensis]|uniref:Uncharacterized protein n=1 Tax=Microcella daejeonensis TaxID=2994971 RepID=A0A9E8MJ31_9MICO|nr:hypothetical protein [Microcella daejeonensis]WAB80472.1 hypothetical protein OVN18_07765 [Microcella daejeonensis]